VAAAEPPANAEDAALLLQDLADGAWSLAAAADVLGRPPQDRYRLDDHPARILAGLGLMTVDGDSFVPAPGLCELLSSFGPAMAQSARSTIGQIAASLAGARARQVWAAQDDETLMAQGRASREAVRMVARYVVVDLQDLSEQLDRPGARILDVGVGVGVGACTFCDEFPEATVVGIDPFGRALALARGVIAEHGVEDRVELRQQGIEELDDVAGFDFAWLPAHFVRPEALAAGRTRLHRALRPGGWLLVGTHHYEGRAVSVEVNRWQTSLLGGSPLAGHELADGLVEAGFADVQVLATPPSGPVLVVGRR
jgi:SAM-dependent methyltransferase